MEELEAIKKRVEKAKEERARLQGRLEGAKADLSGLGYKDIKQAELGLTKLKEKMDLANKNLEERIELFKKNYPQLFEDE